MNDLREDVKNRLVRLKEKINKPDNEERNEKNENVLYKEEEQHCTKPDVVPDIDTTETAIGQTTNLGVKADAMMESADEEALDHIPLAKRFDVVPFATNIHLELNEDTNIHSKQNLQF